MPRRTAWEVKYGVEKTSTISAVPTFQTTSNNFGPAQNVYGIPLTNHPDFDSGKIIVDSQKAFGLSERVAGVGGEYNSEKETPKATLEFEASLKELGFFLWLLFQSGASETGSTPFRKTCNPYTSVAGGGSVPEVYCGIMKDFGGGGTSDEHHLIVGAICKSLTISGSEGGVIQCSAEMIGADFQNSFTEQSNYNLNFSASPALLFKDLTFTLGITAVNISSFSLTFDNQAIQKSYNTGTTQAFVLGRMLCSGNIMIPWGASGAQSQIDNFLNQTLTSLTWQWGVSGTNMFKITTLGRYTGVPVDASGDEVVINASFETARTISSSGITVECEDAVNRGIA